MSAVVLLIGLTVGAEQFTGKVVAVFDGDTIEVLVNRQQVRVRLRSIDAPESEQDFGQKSKAALGEAVFGKVVRVVSEGKDKFDRQLGDVYVGRMLVNEKQLRDGWAWHYVHFSKDPKLAALEQKARQTKRGLWAGNSPTPPWEFREQQAKQRERVRAK